MDGQVCLHRFKGKAFTIYARQITVLLRQPPASVLGLAHRQLLLRATTVLEEIPARIWLPPWPRLCPNERRIWATQMRRVKVRKNGRKCQGGTVPYLQIEEVRWYTELMYRLCRIFMAHIPIYELRHGHTGPTKDV